MAGKSGKDVEELKKIVRSIIMMEKGGMEKGRFLALFKGGFEEKAADHSRTFRVSFSIRKL
jgi:hypothetical protein